MKLSIGNVRKTIVKTENSLHGHKSSRNILRQEKEDFLCHGKIPKLTGQGFHERKPVKVSLEFFNEAKRVLGNVNEIFKSGDRYLDDVFGEKINQVEATKYLVEYLKSEGFVL